MSRHTFSCFFLSVCPHRTSSQVLERTYGYLGGLKGSMQHSSRTRLALKTKAKSLARVRSAGTRPWLGFDRVQPNGSLAPGSIVESMYWLVLRRPSEPAALTGQVQY